MIEKFTSYDSAAFRTILKPSVNENEFHDTSSLNGIEAISKIVKEGSTLNEFKYAFNA